MVVKNETECQTEWADTCLKAMRIIRESWRAFFRIEGLILEEIAKEEIATT